MTNVHPLLRQNSARKSQENPDTYSLVWLDPSANSNENLNTRHKFRSIINYFDVFEDVNQCQEHIRSISLYDRLILITSGQFGLQIIPNIHQLQQVYSIFIYCVNKDFYLQWSQEYTKVKGVHNQMDELILHIQSDQTRRKQNNSNEALSISIYGTNSEKSATGISGQFVHSQLLIDCLRRMPPTPTDKDEFISLCQEIYKNNEKELENIQDFKETYTSDTSIQWYTRDAFLFRLLNKSLRTQNINLLFGLRFLIRDIEQQLEKHRCKAPIRLYRGQFMSPDELEMLKQSKGKLISMNSFFSTTTDPEVANRFVSSSNEEEKSVVFEIDANPCQDGIKPFANISSMSKFEDEEEVLMMLGSVFRVNNIYLGLNQVWIINLTLCSDNDHDLQSVFEHMRNQYGSEQTRLLLFGHVLIDMSHFDDAEKYYLRLLKELPPDHTDMSDCYHALGKVACEKADYEASIEWLKKALDILKNKLRNGHPRNGFIHTAMGEVYQKQGEYYKALESYTTAKTLWTNAFNDQHEYVAWCYNNLGIIYDSLKKYDEAYDYHRKALEIKTRILPPAHPCMGNAHINMGNVYYHFGKYDKALSSYQLAHEIYRKSVPPGHPSLASVMKNIGIIYEVEGNFCEALKSYRQAATMREIHFPPSHPDSVELTKDIQRVLLKMK